MPSTKTRTETLKMLVFPLSHLYLSVKLAGVKKVIPTPEIFKSGNEVMGITHFEEREAIVLDLHQAIYQCPAQKHQGFLVVIDINEQLYGITVEALPEMKELPLDELKPIPVEYRERDTLGIADFMTQVNLQNGRTITTFLLDSDRLLELVPKPHDKQKHPQT